MTKQASRQVGADFERGMGEGEGEWGERAQQKSTTNTFRARFVVS